MNRIEQKETHRDSSLNYSPKFLRVCHSIHQREMGNIKMLTMPRAQNSIIKNNFKSWKFKSRLYTKHIFYWKINIFTNIHSINIYFNYETQLWILTNKYICVYIYICIYMNWNSYTCIHIKIHTCIQIFNTQTHSFQWETIH